jgi:hypothetical protein
MKTTKAKESKLDAARGVFDFLSNTSMEQIKDGKSVESTLFAVMYEKGSDQLGILPVSFGDTQDADERRMIMESIGEMLAEKEADVYLFMTVAEAWASTQKLTKNGLYIRPLLDPKRKELFMASGKDVDGNIRNVSYEIKRKEKGVEFKRLNIFGKSQAKFLFDWHDPKKQQELKIENTLVDTAWESYSKSKKLIKK